MPEAMMTIRDVCERYRVSKSTLYREANAGHIPLVKYGRMTRVRAADADAWAKTVFVRAAADGGDA